MPQVRELAAVDVALALLAAEQEHGRLVEVRGLAAAVRGDLSAVAVHEPLDDRRALPLPRLGEPRNLYAAADKGVLVAVAVDVHEEHDRVAPLLDARHARERRRHARARRLHDGALHLTAERRHDATEEPPPEAVDVLVEVPDRRRGRRRWPRARRRRRRPRAFPTAAARREVRGLRLPRVALHRRVGVRRRRLAHGAQRPARRRRALGPHGAAPRRRRRRLAPEGRVRQLGHVEPEPLHLRLVPEDVRDAELFVVGELGHGRRDTREMSG